MKQFGVRIDLFCTAIAVWMILATSMEVFRIAKARAQGPYTVEEVPLSTPTTNPPAPPPQEAPKAPSAETSPPPSTPVKVEGRRAPPATVQE